MNLTPRTSLLYAAFLFIIVCFAATNLVALIEMRGVQEANRRITENALLSIEDVSRIVHDVDQKRLLIDAHIFERTAHDMQRLEAKIADVDADLDRTSLAYEPLALFDGERAAWERLQEQLAGLRRPIDAVLVLSRANRDTEARAQLVTIEGRLDAINQEGEKLVRINRDASNLAAAQIRALQRRSVFFLGGITLSGIALSLLVAVWVARIMRRRDAQIRDSALLLEERNRELDAFAGRVAHDLRGPLTTVSLSAARLAQHAPAEHEALRRGVTRMEGLIQDLLTLSRIDAQTPGTTAQAAAVVASVEEDVAASIHAAEGVLRIDVAPATVRCSDGLLREALWNLAENAVKYRRQEVRLEVEIHGRDVGRCYQFRVTDNGLGMTSEEALHAFEPFFRGERMRSTPGTGLGLSIVKRVIEVSGGTVSVESQAGHGTTFIINLPTAT